MFCAFVEFLVAFTPFWPAGAASVCVHSRQTVNGGDFPVTLCKGYLIAEVGLGGSTIESLTQPFV